MTNGRQVIVNNDCCHILIERHPTSSSVGATVLFVSLLGKVGTIVSIMGMVGKRVVGEVVGEGVAAVSSTGSERVEGIG